jgi:hypothetical protein
MKVKGRWARSGKEGKSGEPTCAGGVAGRSRAFRWAESDAALRVLTYRDGRALPREPRQIEISDRVTSKEVAAGCCWASQEYPPWGGRAGVGVATGMGDLKATVPGLSMGTNIDAPRALGPNPKQVAPAWSKNPDGPTGLQ